MTRRRKCILQERSLGGSARPFSWKVALRVLGRAALNFADDRGTQLAGAISYFTLFALFPATLVVVSGFGIVLRDEAIQERVLNALIGYLPIAGTTIAESLRQAADLGTAATVASLAGAVWTTGALSAALRQALNRVFDVDVRRPMLRGKLMDFVLLPILAVPLVGGIILTTILQLSRVELQEQWGLLDGRWSWTWNVGAILIPLTLSFIAFAALYRLAPNRRQPFQYLWPGALVAAVAFEGLKAGFGLYLEHFGTYSLYGSLGSVIVLLFWIYLSANILLIGGEISNAIPHVLNEESGDMSEDEADLRRSIGVFLRGLILVPDDDDARPRQAHEGEQLRLAAPDEADMLAPPEASRDRPGG